MNDAETQKRQSGHRVIQDHNGDPICVCGFQATPSATVRTVFQAASQVRLHVRQSEAAPVPKVGNWKFPDKLNVEGDFKAVLDIDAIMAQMRQLEEEATRHAVITWLRAHGYTVTPPISAQTPEKESN